MLSLLGHLPEPPEDFRQQCRRATESKELLRLAGYRLDSPKLEQLARAKNRVGSSTGLDGFRLGILSNASTDFLPAAVSASGLRYGLDVSVVLGDYGQTFQEAANPSSAIYHPRCDAVLLAIDSRGLPLMNRIGAPHRDEVEGVMAYLKQIRDAIKATASSVIIFQTITAPPSPTFGHMDSVIDGTTRAIIHDVNAGIRQMVRDTSGAILLDVAALADTIGHYHWHSPKEWNVAKLQFSLQALPVYADHVTRLLGALRGKSKKCLVLDLDNTLWGGAIGDVGVEGIILGQGSALGEAFLDVQRTALLLRERGVVLAVCSKNDEANALQPFRDHPDMLLREEHISVFQANWIDKATNLEEIARILDIGIESLVLLDDNPAERAQVREALGVVAVPELPDDPSLFSRTLLNAGYFEAVAFTAEDATRADQYKANASRTKFMLSSRDSMEFLKALEMRISFAHFEPLNRGRITQLINKTNQFNLTTQRYTEAEVERMEGDPDTWTLQVRLADRFGDNGMILVVICRRIAPEIWDIDTWLMSCRVLNRRVEECTMAIVVKHALRAGIKTLIGRYRPTKKNEMVREFYGKMGFSLVNDGAAESVWQIDTATYAAVDVPMTIEISPSLERN
jgi:FkbH-like protein